MESFIYLKQKIQSKAVTWLCILSCFLILVSLFSVRKSNFKLGLFLLGFTTSTIGLLSSKNTNELEELLEDSYYIERENRLNRLNNPENIVESKLRKQSNKTIIEANDDWLLDFALRNYHFRICGETGSGKSTFVENLINCLAISLGKSVKIVLIDPKYPLSDFNIESQYKGINEALNGLNYLKTEVETRLKEASLDKGNKLNVRSFEPILFVIDEIDWIANEYGKEASKLLKVGLKVGRALNIKVCYLGQSPLCSDLPGFRKNDFKNSANIILGEMALLGIDEICYPKQKRYILNELENRIDRGDRYYALVKPMSKSPFTAILPKPKQYSFKSLNENIVDSTIVESVDVPDLNDNDKLSKINQLKSEGYTKLIDILPLVYGCPKNHNSKLFKEARSDYKKLTGK